MLARSPLGVPAAKEVKEAPGDSAGGPSASPSGSPAEMSLPGVTEAQESGAEKRTAKVESAGAAPTQPQTPAPEFDAGRVAVRAEHGHGDSSVPANRGINPISHAVAAADSGGGYVADRHNSVRFEEQTNAFAAGSQQVASHESGGRVSPRTPSLPHGGPHGGMAAAPNDEADRNMMQPLIISPDATLVDGLRALLVHHLKRSVGSDIVSLSASQAELLEHHLARLASYAQKIVHTLAFATRFLSKQQDGGDGYPSDPQSFAAGGMGGGVPHNPQYRHDDSNLPNGAATAQQQPPQEPRPPRKSLKLSDDEILSIYRNAQVEAAIEADWRGVEGPAIARQGWTEGEGTSRSGISAPPAGAQESPGGDREYLKMLSRALQEPGRSPRALTAEILDPSTGAVCCQPRVPTMLHGGAGGPPPVLHGSSTSSSYRNGQYNNHP